MTRIGHSSLGACPLAGGTAFGWTTDEEPSFAVRNAYRAAGGDLIDAAAGDAHWLPGHASEASEAP
jgi:hypothetical protein